MSSRKPDFKVCAMSKHTDHKGKVGGAWMNEDGSISIVIDPFVKLEQDGNLLITLFPAETIKPKAKQ